MRQPDNFPKTELTPFYFLSLLVSVTIFWLSQKDCLRIKALGFVHQQKITTVYENESWPLTA